MTPLSAATWLSIAAGVTVRAKNAGRAVLDGQRKMRVLSIHAAGSETVLVGLNITGGLVHDTHGASIP